MHSSSFRIKIEITFVFSLRRRPIQLVILVFISKYMEIGRHRGVTANAHIKIGSNSYEKVETFKYLGSLLTNQNSIQEEIKCRLKAVNSCYFSPNTLVV